MSKITRWLDSLETGNGNWSTRAHNEHWANEYWRRKWAGDLEGAKECDSKLNAPTRDEETNALGNKVVRTNLPADRYLFDFDEQMRRDGWLQFDTSQDAHYFGFWVNPKLRKTLTYCEGDVILVVCPSAAHYNAEIRDAADCYDEGFIAICYDEQWNCTKYVQNRAEFFVPLLSHAV